MTIEKSLALVHLHLGFVESVLKHVIDAGVEVSKELKFLLFLLLNLLLLLCCLLRVSHQIALRTFVEGGGGASHFARSHGALEAL